MAGRLGCDWPDRPDRRSERVAQIGFYCSALLCLIAMPLTALHLFLTSTVLMGVFRSNEVVQDTTLVLIGFAVLPLVYAALPFLAARTIWRLIQAARASRSVSPEQRRNSWAMAATGAVALGLYLITVFGVSSTAFEPPVKAVLGVLGLLGAAPIAAVLVMNQLPSPLRPDLI